MFGKIFACLMCLLLFPVGYVGASDRGTAGNMELSPQVNNRRFFHSIAFSPDSNTIAATTNDEIILWNLNGYFLRSFHHQFVTGVKFNHSGRLLASFDSISRLIMWNPVNGKQLKEFNAHIPQNQVITSIDFSPDDSLVAISVGNSISIWDVNKSSPIINILAAPNKGQILGLYFADSGNAIVTNSLNAITIWDLKGHIVKELNINGLTDVSVQKAGREIVCSSTDTITIRNLNGEVLSLFTPDLNDKESGSVVSDGKKTATSLLYSPLVKVSYMPGTDNIFTFGNRGFQTWTRRGKLVWESIQPERKNMMSPWRFLYSSWKMEISPNGGFIAMRNPLGEMELWDAASLKQKHLILRQYNSVSDLALFAKDDIDVAYTQMFNTNKKPGPILNHRNTYTAISSDRSMIAVSSKDGYVQLFKQNWTLLDKFQDGVNFTWISPLSFSPDSKELVAFKQDKSNKEAVAVIRSVPSGRILSEIPLGLKSAVTELQFMPDGKTLLVGEFGGALRLIDIQSKRTLKVLQGKSETPTLNSVLITENGTILIPYFGRIQLFDNAGNSLPAIKFAEDTFFASVATYNAKHNWISVGGYAGYIVILDLATGKVIKNIPDHLPDISQLKFSSDGGYLASSSSDGVLRIWDTKNWNDITVLSANDQWLIYTSDGYFDASVHGGELVAMINGLEGYGIEQFAARNNRPDLILERMGLGTSEQISHYYLQYQKRLKKLGLSEALLTADVHAPDAKITKTILNGKFLDVSFCLSDPKYLLKRYDLFVNDVPVFGASGKYLSTNRFAGTERIELTAGKNKIEISALNEAGAESYRALTHIDYEDTAKRSLYYLAFGVSKYKDPSLKLNYADKDAKDLEATFSKMRPAYSDIHVKTFLNSEVTSDSIKNAKDFIKNANVDDTVILFLAGHGGYDTAADPQYYYLPYDADQHNLPGTGIAFESIENLFVGIKPRKKLLLLDTCESGELDEETYTRYYASANARGIKPRTSRKPGKPRGDYKQNNRRYLLEKDRFIYNDLARRSGAIVFSSSRGNELSYESSTIENGFFSREIINALANRATDKDLDGKVSIDELRVAVSEAVSKDTDGLQNPTIDRDNLSQQIELPLF